MSTLIEVIHEKLGFSDEPLLQSKTTELMRLLELRSTNIPAQINEYGKIVLCADIAANLLSTDFDKELAMKLSNLRKTQYTNFKRLFEKLLDINRVVGTKDICIQLGLNSVNQKADEFLALYEKHIAADDVDIDIKHPQYASMAVFQACKILKTKVIKPKIMSFSHLRPTQWTMLEQRWDKFLAQYYKKPTDNQITKSDGKTTTATINNDIKNKENIALKSQKINKTEDYEDWKQRMLEMANAKLKLLQTKMNKENE